MRVSETKLTLTNTCGFDSIFQLMLAASTDNEDVYNYAKENQQKNSAFELVVYTATTRKITTKTYALRAKVGAMHVNLLGG